MKIDILTLFPEMYNGIFSESIVKRAIDLGKIEINIHNFRDYSLDLHHKVDDTPYGGGAGMVLTCQPIFDCVRALKTDDTGIYEKVILKDFNSNVIDLTPDNKNNIYIFINRTI